MRLGVQRWTLFGGSWGVALALAYATTHPHAVRGLILRGVCLLRKTDVDWAFRGGAAALFPGAYAAFTAAVGADVAAGDDPVARAHAMLCGVDAAQRAQAASAWLRWGSVLGSPPPLDGVQVWGGSAWASQSVADANAGAAALAMAAAAAPASAPQSSTSVMRAAAVTTAPDVVAVSNTTEAQALLEAHYCLHDGFSLRTSPLLSRLGPLICARVPAVAIHGRLDALCPVEGAWALHRAWPELELRVVGGAGHSQYDARITHELLCATDAFRALPM